MTIHNRRLRRLVIRLPLILFGTFAGVLVCEVGLRLADYSYPEFYQLDYARGYSLRPGMEGWYRKEGKAYVRINSKGLRDVDHAESKRPDTIRIALLGDSYAEALQVSQEQAFWSVMESQLRNCADFVRGEMIPGALLKLLEPSRAEDSSGPSVAAVQPQVARKIEVVNFGVSGYSTAQQLLTLREHVWAYSPDLVLLTVTTNNLISDNSRQLKKTDEIPYFVYQNGRLVLDDSFRRSRAFRLRQSFISQAGRWLKDHSRLAQAVNESHRGFKVLLALLKARLRNSESASAGQIHPGETSLRSEVLGVDNVVYAEPTRPVWSEAWNVTKNLIKEVSVEVTNHGARLVVITLSNPPQVAPNPDVRKAFMKRIGVNELFYPDKRIRQFAERVGISTITLAPELQTYAEKNNVYLHGFDSNIGNGHWNAEGHRAAGELIARKLCEISRR